MNGFSGSVDMAERGRIGVMQVLVSSIARPPGEFDPRSAIELVRICLKTYAWCVHEETIRSLRAGVAQGGSPVSYDLLSGLLANAEGNRSEYMGRLTEFAVFLATAAMQLHPEPNSVQ